MNTIMVDTVTIHMKWVADVLQYNPGWDTINDNSYSLVEAMFAHYCFYWKTMSCTIHCWEWLYKCTPHGMCGAPSATIYTRLFIAELWMPFGCCMVHPVRPFIHDCSL